MYFYGPRDKQVPSFWDTSFYLNAGIVVARGSWRYVKGQWNDMELSVVLNTPGVADGRLRVSHNGRVVVDVEQVYFRHTADQLWDSVFLQTFYGGKASWWAPTQPTRLLLGNFSLSVP